MPSYTDLQFEVRPDYILPEADQTTTARTTTGVQVTEYDDVLLAVVAKNDAAADAVVNVKMQESDDNSAWTDVPDSDKLERDGKQFTLTNGGGNIVVYRGSYVGLKKYVRLHMKATGSPTAGKNKTAAVALRCMKNDSPVA